MDARKRRGHACVSGRPVELAADAGDDPRDRRGRIFNVELKAASVGLARDVPKRPPEEVPFPAVRHGRAHELIGVRPHVEERRVEDEASVVVGEGERLLDTIGDLSIDRRECLVL